jgi:hypothetical protein
MPVKYQSLPVLEGSQMPVKYQSLKGIKLPTMGQGDYQMPKRQGD